MSFFQKKKVRIPAATYADSKPPAVLPTALNAELVSGLIAFVEKNMHVDCAVLDAHGSLIFGETSFCRKNSVKDPALCAQTRENALNLVRQTLQPHSGGCELGVRFAYIPVVAAGEIPLVFLLSEEQRKYNISPERFRLAQRVVGMVCGMFAQILCDDAQSRMQYAKQNAHIGELREALSCTVFENEVIGEIFGSSDLESAIHGALKQVGEYYSLARITVLRLACDFGEQKLLMQWCKPGYSSFEEYFEGEGGQALWQSLTTTVNWAFDKDGFLHISDLSVLPERLTALFESGGIKDVLCHQLKNELRPVAVIVFERTGADSRPDETGYDDTRLVGLKAASTVLCSAVLQKLAMDYANHAKDLMYTIADGNGSATYAVDVNTREILFMNRTMQLMNPNVKPGDLCTRLENLDDGQICAFCPIERFAAPYESAAYKRMEPRTLPCADNGQLRNEQLRMEIYKSKSDTWYELLASRFTWFDGRLACLVSQTDINSRKVFELEIEKLAYYDAMLDIPNRVCLTKVLQKVFESPSPSGSVIILDLDDFKYVNDTLGSHYGDELLRRIVQYFNESDELLSKVFRFGGDEFFILLQDYGLAMAQDLAQRLLSRFSRPWRVFDVDCTCTVSLGIAAFPESGKDPKEIIASGEFAIYDAKTTGKNRYVLYDEILSRKLARRHKIQEIMRRALKEGGFDVYYQPIYNIEKQGFTKAEALLRLRDEELGFIPPDEFIGIAEEIGLINDIGLIVVDRVCKTLCELAQQGIVLDSMAINISPLQLVQENFVDSMWGVISRYELPPTILEFEITENVVIRSFESVKKTMSDLQRYGIRFVLDDFGSGYSGLNYLLMLPISSLKIDKSYINQLEGSAKSRKMLSKIIELVQDFNMQVVAEGVETVRQDSILKQLNCDYIQGYLYSRPLPRADFELVLADSIKAP